MGLPTDVAKTKITIYNYFKYSNGKETYQKKVINDAYFRNNSLEIFKHTGNEVDEAIEILLNYSSSYVNKDDWHKLTSITNKFTLDNSINGRNTIIVLGECTYEFGVLEPASFSAKTTEFANLYPNHKKVKEVFEALYGSQDLWHIRVKC